MGMRKPRTPARRTVDRLGSRPRPCCARPRPAGPHLEQTGPAVGRVVSEVKEQGNGAGGGRRKSRALGEGAIPEEAQGV